MTVDFEYLWDIYPEWESHEHPLLVFLKIFVIITFFLLIPYIYIEFFEDRLRVMLEKYGRIRLHLIRNNL